MYKPRGIEEHDREREEKRCEEALERQIQTRSANRQRPTAH
jgi:hypothetical protein